MDKSDVASNLKDPVFIYYIISIYAIIFTIIGHMMRFLDGVLNFSHAIICTEFPEGVTSRIAIYFQL